MRMKTVNIEYGFAGEKVLNSNCLLKLDFVLKIVNLIFFLFEKVPEQSKKTFAIYYELMKKRNFLKVSVLIHLTKKSYEDLTKLGFRIFRILLGWFK